MTTEPCERTLYNPEAENGIIGYLIGTSKDRMPLRKAVDDIGSDPDIFRDSNNRRAYQAILRCIQNGLDFDIVNVSNACTELFGTDSTVVMDQIVTAIKERYQHPFEVKNSIALLRRLYSKRQLYQALETQSDLLCKDGSVTTESVTSNLRNVFRGLEDTGKINVNLGDILIRAYDAFDRTLQGKERFIPTGFSYIDKRLGGGMHNGSLIVIGARPSVGKSACAIAMIMKANELGFRCGLCSLEMTPEEIGTRMLSSKTLITADKLRDPHLPPQEQEQVALAYTQLASGPELIQGYFDERFIEDLCIRARNDHEEGKIDFLVVDHIGLLRSREKFRDHYLEVGHITRQLKLLALDTGMPIVALSQVNRAADEAMPTMAELRGSGDIEQDADVIILLHRPVKMDDPYINPRDRPLLTHNGFCESHDLRYLAINLSKNRQGPTGNTNLIFDPGHNRFFIPSEAHS